MKTKHKQAYRNVQDWLESIHVQASHVRFDLLPPRLSREQRRMIALAFCWSDDLHIRDDALDLLISNCEEADLSVFMKFSRDRKWVIRCTAAAGLGEFEAQAARDRLVQMVHSDPYFCVRRWALHAISERDFPNHEVVVPLAREVLSKREHASVLLVALAILQLYNEGPGMDELEKLPNYVRPRKQDFYILTQDLRPLMLSQLRSQRAKLAYIKRQEKISSKSM